MKVKTMRKSMKLAKYEVMTRRVQQVKIPWYVKLIGLFKPEYRANYVVQRIRFVRDLVNAGTKKVAHALTKRS